MTRDEMLDLLETTVATIVAENAGLVASTANEPTITHYLANKLRENLAGTAFENHNPPLFVDVEYSRVAEVDPITGELTAHGVKYVKDFAGETLMCHYCEQVHVPNRHQGHWVRPDLIIHDRDGGGHNVLAVECKHEGLGTSQNVKLQEQWSKARKKIRLYRRHLHYTYAALVVFKKGDAATHIFELLSDGNELDL